MPGDLERLPPSAAGPAMLAAELPVIGELGERDQVLVAAWLTGCGPRALAVPTSAT